MRPAASHASAGSGSAFTTTQPILPWVSASPRTTFSQSEPTPASFADYNIVTEILYVLQTASNELMQNPSVGFGAILASMALRSLLRKLEADIIGGTTGSDACPSAAMIPVITTTSTNDQGTVANATIATVGGFLADCIADNSYASDTAGNTLFMHPSNVLSLALQSVSDTNLPGALVWGDARKGIPPTLLGYRLISTPACVRQSTTAKWMLLFDPKNVFLGEDAAFSVDFSEHVYFHFNSTALRFANHYDWCFPMPLEIHGKIIT